MARKGLDMKRLRVVIEMDDDAPEGSALLVALGNLVRDVLTIVGQKSCVVDCWPPEHGVRVVCNWMPPKADA